jgi:hypothetical protein
LNNIVSGALDRLHYEKDPCVKYDLQKKLWIYLHKNRPLDYPPWNEHLKKPEPVKVEIELKDDTLLDQSNLSQTPQKNDIIIDLMNSSVNNITQSAAGSNSKKSRKNKEEKKENKEKSEKQKSSGRGDKGEKMLKNKRKHSP